MVTDATGFPAPAPVRNSKCTPKVTPLEPIVTCVVMESIVTDSDN